MNATARNVCRWTTLILTSALFSLGAAAASELRIFNAHSFTEIREAAKGRPVVVAFWSTTCAPCAHELGLLARLQQEFPRVNVVLIAADPPELKPKVAQFLRHAATGAAKLWQFNEESEDRLRYSVDHAWRGELPRAYFIGADGTMITRSGVPDEAWSADWFRREAAAPAASGTAPAAAPAPAPTPSS